MSNRKADGQGAPGGIGKTTPVSAKGGAAETEKAAFSGTPAAKADVGNTPDAAETAAAKDASAAGETAAADPIAAASGDGPAGSEKPEDGVSAAKEEELNQKYMRLAADFQNYKRRVEKEKNEIYAFANEKIVTSLLDVTDNFERALEHNGDPAQEESFAKGMELIFRQLLDVLSKNEVEEIDCLGAEFDPAAHHAVMMEVSDQYENGTISAVLKKGYRLRDKVIRPAMVKVAGEP